MKAIVTLSKTFFPNHPKAGQETNFKQSVINGQVCERCSGKHSAVICIDLNCSDPSIVRKIHTCRSNYENWKKKIDRLKESGGVLSVRQWSGKPYRSPQETIIDIPAEFVGVQKLTFDKDRDGNTFWKYFTVDRNSAIELETLANNDGLSLKDLKEWFSGEDLNNPMAIIHFTKFRY